MAKRGYSSYNSRSKKRQNLTFLIIAVIIATAVFFAFKVLHKPVNEPENPSETSLQTQVPDSIEPEETSATKNGEAPRYLANEQQKTQETRYVKQLPGSTATSTNQPNNVRPADTGGSQAVVELPQTDSPFEVTKNAINNPPVVSVMPVDDSQAARDAVEEAKQLVRGGDIIKARDLLNTTLNRYPSSLHRSAIKDMLTKLADSWLFNDKVMLGDTYCQYYRVQPGDMLSKIGRKFDVPWEFLLKINNMKRAESLMAGQNLKVVTGPFNVIVDKSTFTMDLYLDSLYVKTYRIGIGKDENTTPTGMWVVSSGGKMVSPAWTDPDSGRTYDATDPDYPLGKRWLALNGLSGEAAGRMGFAIHGTNEPESIGQKSSRGCIRLENTDVVEVYDLLMAGVSQVQVVN